MKATQQARKRRAARTRAQIRCSLGMGTSGNNPCPRQSERRKTNMVKEVRFSVRTEEHDLRVKAAAVQRILEGGHRTKVVRLPCATSSRRLAASRRHPCIGREAPGAAQCVMFRNTREAGDESKRAEAQRLLDRVLGLLESAVRPAETYRLRCSGCSRSQRQAQEAR